MTPERGNGGDTGRAISVAAGYETRAFVRSTDKQRTLSFFKQIEREDEAWFREAGHNWWSGSGYQVQTICNTTSPEARLNEMALPSHHTWLCLETDTAKVVGIARFVCEEDDRWHFERILMSQLGRPRGLGKAFGRTILGEIQRRGAKRVKTTVGSMEGASLFAELGFRKEQTERGKVFLWTRPQQD